MPCGLEQIHQVVDTGIGSKLANHGIKFSMTTVIQSSILSNSLHNLGGRAPSLFRRLVKIILPKLFIRLAQEDSALCCVSIRYNHDSMVHGGLEPLAISGS